MSTGIAVCIFYESDLALLHATLVAKKSSPLTTQTPSSKQHATQTPQVRPSPWRVVPPSVTG